MLAVQASKPDLGSLQVVDVPEPSPTPSQVLVDVEAAGLGHLDLVCIAGHHQLRPSFPFVPGFEVAGRVRFAPPGSGFERGQRVTGFVDFGGLAEVAAVEPSVLLPVPESWTIEEAAALPVNAFTAAFALVGRAGIAADEVVIIHGAGGGLGLAAIAICSYRGAESFAVVSTPERAQLAREAGATEAVIADEDWTQQMRAALSDHGHERAGVVFDPVGGDRLEQSLRCLGPYGRLLSLGFVAGTPRVSAARLLVRNASLIGVDWMPDDPLTEKVVAPWLRLALASGALRPRVTSVCELAEAGEVLGRLERRELAGKAVLRLGERDDGLRR